MTPPILAGTQATIPIEKLVPFRNVGGLRVGQPRTHFDEAELAGLAQSIRSNGFTSQLDVRPMADGRFEVLAGHRRLRAAGMAGMAELPCVVRDLDDKQARGFVLTDNLQRVDFLAWEEGDGYRELADVHGMTPEQIAAKVGKGVQTVRDRLSLLTLGPKAKELYLAKELTGEALVQLAKLPDRILSPVKCHLCRVVLPEGTQVCTACQADLSGAMVFPSGNPQEVAAKAVRGMSNGSVAQVIQKVKEAYGIADVPVQTSLGFSEAQLSQAAVLAKTRLESALAEVARVCESVVAGKHEKELREATDRQKEAVGQQLDAAFAALNAIRKAVQG